LLPTEPPPIHYLPRDFGNDIALRGGGTLQTGKGGEGREKENEISEKESLMSQHAYVIMTQRNKRGEEKEKCDPELESVLGPILLFQRIPRCVTDAAPTAEVRSPVPFESSNPSPITTNGPSQSVLSPLLNPISPIFSPLFSPRGQITLSPPGILQLSTEGCNEMSPPAAHYS